MKPCGQISWLTANSSLQVAAESGAHKVSFTIRYPEVQKEVNLKNPELANPKVSFELNWVCL